MPVESPECYLYLGPNRYKSEVPRTSSMCLINLLEHLTELRETFYLLDYQFVIRVYSSGTARWKTWIGQGMGKGKELPYPLQAPSHLTPLRVHQLGSSLNSILSDFYRGFTTQVWLIKSSTTGGWTQSPAPSPLPQVSRMGLEVSTS